MLKAEVTRQGRNWYVNVTMDGRPFEFIPCRTKKAAETLAASYKQ